MATTENPIEQQQQLAMLVELYFESNNYRVINMDDRANECIAEFFELADEMFEGDTALVFELLNVFKESQVR
ncbi:hypothetical protein [Natronorubrum bangense]|uniref:Uncharacterized protein n=2 Tax=Natronorubrum bangense TaxID=61858 RepID=L9WK91_9EURY|nr:hypothetical protein [Natronorubrum bangense]ELY49869.1 hypothetical protein C494_07660 [Natronorubrum bangense JCM 10635]QCC55488.1 hypothetical protein DV706_14035 [Natronorubrum bangense]